jgi:predicted RNA-binding protein with PIN domain
METVAHLDPVLDSISPRGRAGRAPTHTFRFQSVRRTLSCAMALIRILVDGYSLLHHWSELAPGKARHSAAARDELIRVLTLYRDAVGTPITIFFDGSSPKRNPAEKTPSSEVEILYSRSGQTADDMIERAAHRFQPYGEVLAVTDDNAERDTVIGLGGMASSCGNFIQTVQNTLAELQDEIKHHNRRERNKFNRRF